MASPTHLLDIPRSPKFTLKAFEEAEKLGDKATIKSTASRLCFSLVQCGEAARTIDLADRAMAIIGEPQRTAGGTLPEFDFYANLLTYFGWAKALLGEFDEGEKQFRGPFP